MKRHAIHGLAMIALGPTASACQVNKTQEGKMPKVDVKTSEGQLPVEVGSKNETVKVPTVHVTKPSHKN